MSDNIYSGVFYLSDVRSTNTTTSEYNNAVSLHPTWDFAENHLVDIERNTSITGKLYSYKLEQSKGYSYSIPVEFVTTSDHLQINEWWSDQRELYFIVDEVSNTPHEVITSGDVTISADTKAGTPYTISTGDTVTIESTVYLAIIGEQSFLMKGLITNKNKPIGQNQQPRDDKWNGFILFKSTENSPTFTTANG